ncbi:MAG: hypothetical protein RLZZ630_588 [Bacteroidota bacterium]|jgi:hypothetical protein
MKKSLILTLLCASLAGSSSAQSLKVPAPSPSQTIKQDFALSNIELSYSRPSVKSRVIFGDIVPFGKVWRTGANSATTITFGDTVQVGGSRLVPGKYGLLTIPGKDSWTIIISKSTTTTGPESYKQEDDAARVEVKPIALSSAVETFTIQFADMKSTSCMLQLMWDRTLVQLPIQTEIDARIMKDIQRMVINDNRPYSAAANYYLENGKDLKLALEWFDKAIGNNPSAYWTIHQKANCQAKLGMKKEAVETATKSMALAKEDGDDHYVNLNQKLIDSLK